MATSTTQAGSNFTAPTLGWCRPKGHNRSGREIIETDRSKSQKEVFARMDTKSISRGKLWGKKRGQSHEPIRRTNAIGRDVTKVDFDGGLFASKIGKQQKKVQAIILCGSIIGCSGGSCRMFAGNVAECFHIFLKIVVEMVKEAKLSSVFVNLASSKTGWSRLLLLPAKNKQGVFKLLF
jgi:hypothetical protein